MQGNSACVHFSGVFSLRRAFTTLMHYAEIECVMPIGLHCNEIRALCLTTNAICRICRNQCTITEMRADCLYLVGKGVYPSFTICSNILTLDSPFFFTILEPPGGGGAPHPRHPATDCTRALQQRPADRLGRSESNGVRIDLFRSTVDLPGPVKLQKSVSRYDSFCCYIQ